jgi:antitoxin VapB
MQTAKIFQNGQSQAVRLPREFRFSGDCVFIKKVGDAVILLPYRAPWQTLIDSLDEFSADFMAERVQPLEQEREELFP